MVVNNEEYCCLEPGSESRGNRKILLVYPKVGAEAKNVSLYPPLSLLYLAACLKDYSVAIFDQRVDDIIKFEKFLDQKPLCVGFSIITGVQIKHALELARQVKEKNIPTIFGGVHATILPQQTQQNDWVDYVVAGDGELALRNLADALANNRKVEPVVTNGSINLDRIPPLPYELVDVENYVISSAIEGRSLPFLFSRGCPFACTFCCNPVISKKSWRTMNVETAVAQLDNLVDKYHLDAVIFWDENLAVKPEILTEMAHRINGRYHWFAQSRANALLQYDLNFLEKMGVRRLSCGLESGAPDVLQKIKKQETVEEYIEVNRRLSQTNINVWYNYIIAYPFETLDDLKLTISLAMQILDENPHANNNTFYLLTPYPGTEIGDHYYKSCMPTQLTQWADFGRHNFDAQCYNRAYMKLYERICFSSKFVGRRLLTLFPGDIDLNKLVEIMSDKWRKFDFENDREWEQLNNTAWQVLKKLFGENAY